VKLTVRLTPRAAKDQLGPFKDGVLQARVTAPPVDGKANAALCALLAKAAGIPKSRVRVVGGQTARIKVVELEGVDAFEL